MVTVDPNNGLVLPNCSDGQLIQVNADKSLSCISVSGGMLAPPNCLPGTQALTASADSNGNVTLSCVNKGQGANDTATETRITNASTAITNLATQVTTIQAGGGIRSKYVGTSKATTNGKYVNGNLIGLYAANQTCAADLNLPNAHVCTPFEIYESIITAKAGDPLDGTTDQGPFWIYLEAWNDPSLVTTGVVAAYDATAGLNESCGAGTYLTADHKWSGTTFTFNASASGATRVPKFTSSAPGGAEGCNQFFKLACCN